MRKLALLTAAAALVAVMFASPASSGSRSNTEVAILKCAEINRLQEIEGPFFKVKSVTNPPQVALFQSTFLGPEACNPIEDSERSEDALACAPCLKELINQHACELKATVVVGTDELLFEPSSFEILLAPCLSTSSMRIIECIGK